MLGTPEKGARISKTGTEILEPVLDKYIRTFLMYLFKTEPQTYKGFRISKVRTFFKGGTKDGKS